MTDIDDDEDVLAPELRVRFDSLLDPLMGRLATAKAIGASLTIDPEQIGALRGELQAVLDVGQYCQDAVLASRYTTYNLWTFSREAASILAYAMWAIGWLYAWIVLKVMFP